MGLNRFRPQHGDDSLLFAIARLSDASERYVITAVYLEGHSEEHVAEQLRKSPREIARIKQRALQNINKLLAR